MDDNTNLDGKTRFGQVRELYNQDRDANEGITLETLAEKYHISASTLSRIETGKQEPNVSVLKAYSETFGVTLEYLLGMNESADMKATTIIRGLGLTDTSAITLREMVDLSSKENDLSAVANAFLGNREATVGFFQGLLYYLKNDDNDMLSDIFFRSLKKYIESAVKPKLRMVIEKSLKEDEAIANIPDEIKYAEIADTPDN